MKRLTEIEYKEISQRGISNEKKKQLDDFLSKIKQYIPDAEYIYYINSDNFVLDVRIEFQRDRITFYLRELRREKKYEINAIDEHLRQIDDRDREKVKAKYSRPNNIGIFTTKKITSWINFSTQVYKELEKMNQVAQEQEDNFLKSLEGENIQWINNHKGKICKNSIIYEFDILPGFISERVRLDVCIKHNYETFKKLSDNGLK